MRSTDEYRHILQLWESGLNKSQISRKTSIPRGTVCDCIRKFDTEKGLDDYLHIKKHLSWRGNLKQAYFRENYSYSLGIYLGDGYIATHRRTYRLRIVLDQRYPNIIDAVMNSIQILLPENSVNTQQRTGAIEVNCYSNDWAKIFPQHGAGVKHEREIRLEEWQQSIVDEYPIAFIRGLIQSDGTRINPKVNGKVYSRYEFKNVSDDIRSLFCNTLRKLNLNWTQWNNRITIARRSDVAFLDQHVGAKS